MVNCVYRFLNSDNEIIYIGKAKNLKQRIKGHNHLQKECYDERTDIEYVEFETELDMDFAERYYIQTNTPKYNTILANKNINISSFELDNKTWMKYNNNEAYIIEENINTTTNQDMVNEMKVLNEKIEMLIDIWREGICDDFIDEKIKELRLQKDNLKNDIIKNFELENEPSWLIENYVNNNVYTKADLIDIKIEDIKNEFKDKCIKQIEEYGYYKLDIYEEIDNCFICGRLSADWLKLLDGEYINGGTIEYKINTNLKNNLLCSIVENIEDTIRNKYGNLNKKVIFEQSNCHEKFFRNFYNNYEYYKFEKPFVVYEICA